MTHIKENFSEIIRLLGTPDYIESNISKPYGKEE